MARAPKVLDLVRLRWRSQTKSKQVAAIVLLRGDDGAVALLSRLTAPWSPDGPPSLVGEAAAKSSASSARSLVFQAGAKRAKARGRSLSSSVSNAASETYLARIRLRRAS